MESKVDLMNSGDFKELCKLLDQSFSYTKPFDKTYCHICNNLPENYAQHLVIRDKGKIVSHVGVFPMPMKIYGGGILRIGGIGAVATFKKYRGRGFMNLLIEKSIKEMKNKYDISWLSGDRRRYRTFGWENSGRKAVFTLNARSVKKIKVLKFNIRKCKKEPEYLKAIEKLHDGTGLGIKRSPTENKLVYNRLKKDIYLAFKGNRPVSYIIININQDRLNKKLFTANVNEYGGNIEGIKALAKYVIEQLGCEKLTVATPVYNNRYKRLFTGMTSLVSIAAYGEMLKILNLKGVLKSYDTKAALAPPQTRSSGTGEKNCRAKKTVGWSEEN